MHRRLVAAFLFLACAAPAARAQAMSVNLAVGDFTFQFADPTTGQPITSLNIPTVGGTAPVAVYLVQTGGTPGLFQQLGVEGLGVRLNYASPAGVVMVPNTFNASITSRPPPAFNPNGNSSDFDLVQRYGSGAGTNTAASAAIFDGLYQSADPLPFPGPEDPQGQTNRMLVGTFTLQAETNGVESVTAVSGPNTIAGVVNNITGPNPPIIGSRNDGTTGPLPGNAHQGEVYIDQYLAQYLATPDIPTLTVIVGSANAVPEPSTFALGMMAASGMAVRRRRVARKTSR